MHATTHAFKVQIQEFSAREIDRPVPDDPHVTIETSINTSNKNITGCFSNQSTDDTRHHG